MGRSDVLYLHEWLKLKPQLTDFVKGGWLEEEGYTSFSTDDVIASSKRSSTGSCTTPKKKKTRDKSEGDDVIEKVTAVLQNLVSVQQSTEKRKTSNDTVRAQADTLSREQQSQLHHMTMLKEVREAISSIRKEMFTAGDDYKEELKVDLEFYSKQ